MPTLVSLLLFALLGSAASWLLPRYYTASASILISGTLADPNQNISATSDLQTLETDRLKRLAELARLQAELDDKPDLELPVGALGGDQSQLLNPFLSTERQLFQTRRQSLQQSVAGLSQQKKLFEEEAKSLESQIELEIGQERLMTQEIEKVRKLVEQGLTQASRLLDLERTGAVLASRRIELNTELLKARQNAVSAEQRAAEVQNNRRSEVLADIQEAESALKQFSAKVDAASKLKNLSMIATGVSDSFLSNQIELMSSDTMLRAVSLRLSPENRKALGFQPNPDVDVSGSGVSPLRNGLTIWTVGSGGRLDIRFTSHDPDLSAEVVRALSTEFIDLKKAAPGSSGVNVEVARAAEVSNVPDGPSASKIIIAAVFLGLAFGCAVGLLRAYFNGAFRPQ